MRIIKKCRVNKCLNYRHSGRNIFCFTCRRNLNDNDNYKRKTGVSRG